MVPTQLVELLTLLAAFPLLSSAQLTPSPTYAPPSPTAGLTKSSSTPNTQWANVLGNSLYFFDAQRSGKLEQGTYGNRVAWRNDSALNDGSDYGVDLTGGWYDAGDYIKATFPLVHTLFAISWSALTHGQGYSIASQTAYLDGTLRWGYDWLMKAHPSDDVLFVQVGDSDIDNSYWGGDRNIATPRPAFPVNSSFPGTDVWAASSAAMQLANSSSSDPYYVNVQAGTYSIPSGQPCDAALPCGNRLPAGAIAGIVLGCLAFLVLVAGLIWWGRRRRRYSGKGV